MIRAIITVSVLCTMAAPSYARDLQYQSQAKSERRSSDLSKSNARAAVQEEQYRSEKKQEFINNRLREDYKKSSRRMQGAVNQANMEAARAAEFTRDAE